MKNSLKSKLNGDRLEFIIKLFLIGVLIFFTIFQFSREKLASYYSYRDYAVYENTENLQYTECSTNGLSQKFMAKGNVLSNVYIYLNDTLKVNDELEIVIRDSKGLIVFTKTVPMADVCAGNWNRIDINMSKLKRGNVYFFEVLSNADIQTNISYENKNQSVFLECFQNGQNVEYTWDLGLQFTHSYLSLGDSFILTLKSFYIICIIALLSFTIYDIKNIYKIFLLTEKKRGFIYALLGALSTILLINPLDPISTEVSEFKRVFGAGFIRNYDVSKTIRNFEGWLLVFAIVFCLLLLLINYKKKEWDQIEDIRYTSFLDNLVILALTVQLLRGLTFFYDKLVMDSIFYYSSYLVGLWIFVVGLVITTGLNKVIDYESLIRILLISFSAGFPLSILISETWQSGKILIGVQGILIGLNLIIVYVAKFKKNNLFDRIYNISSLFLSFVPLLTSAYIELVHILNQHNIFVAHLKRTYFFIGILYVVIIILVSMIVKPISFQKWKVWAYGASIFGISCLSVQIPLQQVMGADIFESANYSILISDFLNFGSIPIVEHYGGHMMQGVWEGIIYALLNNDYQGAILSPYSVYIYPVLAILFFWLLKNMWNEDIAVWAVLLIPFNKSFEYFGLGVLICVAVVAYVRKRSWLRAFGIWLAVAWCAIYRVDLGFAFALSAICALILYAIRQRKPETMKQLGISFAVTVAGGGGGWVILCFVKNLDPFKRLREFIEISASNQNWAYYGIGDSSKVIFAWCYIIVPLIMVLCILYIAFSQGILKKINVEGWIILLILGLSYFFNFQRGLTRHSLVENATTIILWCALLFIALFLAVYFEKKYLCIPFLVILAVCNAAFTQVENYAEPNIIDTATAKLNNFVDTWAVQGAETGNHEGASKTYWEELADKKEKIIRVTNTLDKEILAYQNIMNLLLEDDETYIDFMTRTFIYSAIGRRCPVYVAQSPLILSGEYSQEQFVAEIQADIDNIPVAILPVVDSRLSVGYDGIANAYRYYKVSEFIYKNYRPLCSNGEFAVWCLKDRYEDMSRKLELIVQEADLGGIIKLPYHDCTILRQTNGIEVSAAGTDPRIEDLQTVVDMNEMVGGYATISVEYQINQTGLLQLFYTTEAGENYSEEKSCTLEVSDKGVADFQIQVTEHTKLRLDIPNECTIKIYKITCGISRIDWGYDGNTVSQDESGNMKYSYYSQLHNYALDQLPRIWAEKDVENAVDNKILYTAEPIENTYVFSQAGSDEDYDASYLLLSCEYLGQDVGGKYEADDESIRGVVRLGWYDEDMFTEKCRYSFTIKEGEHDYLIRISTDYFWHLGEINAMQFYTDDNARITGVKVLEGD